MKVEVTACAAATLEMTCDGSSWKTIIMNYANKVEKIFNKRHFYAVTFLYKIQNIDCYVTKNVKSFKTL